MYSLHHKEYTDIARIIVESVVPGVETVGLVRIGGKVERVDAIFFGG